MTYSYGKTVRGPRHFAKVAKHVADEADGEDAIKIRSSTLF